MDMQIHGDGKSFELNIKIRWAAVKAFGKMAVTTVISLLMLWPMLAEQLHNVF